MIDIISTTIQLYTPKNMENTPRKTALQVLQKTGRTFYIPISRSPPYVQQILVATYLITRGVDQVEDHETMPPATKILLLRNISFALQSVGPEGRGDHITIDWLGQEHLLPEVTIRIPEWLLYCPAPHRARVADVSATMTDRMAVWVERNWKINSEDDLNVYCFAVAGAVCMLFLSDIWEWFDGIRVDRGLAVAYGRAFQSVNILKNIAEDAERGVSFYPPGWTQKDMIAYCRKNLVDAKAYVDSLPEGTAGRAFCHIPYALAAATVEIIDKNLPKLTRKEVMQICKIGQ